MSLRLSDVAQSLEAVNRDSESTFMRIGEQLESIYTEALNLQNEATSTVDLIGQRSDDDVLAEVFGLTTDCVKELWNWESRISTRLTHLGEVAEYLGHLAPSSFELTGIARLLNTINFYFAVESSRHNESSEAFSAYIAVLGKLVRNILQVTEDIQRESNDAQNAQNHACTSLGDGIAELKTLAGVADAAMQEASSEVNEIVKLTSAAMTHIAKLSNDVSEQMGNVVLALQFHDIVRQQIEHVVEALRDVERLADTACASEEYRAMNIKDIECAYSILSVQSLQIKQATSTIKNAHLTIHRSFANIGNHSDALVAGIAAVDDNPGSSTDLANGLGGLSEAMSSLQHLLSDAQILGGQAGDAAELAAKATLLLSTRAEQVDDISLDINIQALNAVITSVRLKDKGVTLMVLAKEVTALSRKCDKCVTRIVDDLERIKDMAVKVTENDFVESEDTVSSLSAAVQRISDVRSAYESRSESMVERAKRVQMMIMDTGGMLEFLPKMADQFDQYSTTIEGIINDLRVFLPKGYTGDQRLLDEQAKRYTMAIERDTQQGLQTVRASTERRKIEEFTMGGCKPQMSPVDDNLGDNVELF